MTSLQHSSPAAHEVRWLFHTTAMVRDYAVTLEALQRLVGCRPLEDHVLDDPAVGRRGGMTWIGDNSLELGEPTLATGAVARTIERFGSHMSSVAVQVADIEATIAHLGAVGVRVASRVEDFLFTDPRHTAGVVIEWYGQEAPNDPRFGTVMPPYAVPPLLDVTHMAFAGAVVADPVADAHRLAEVFGTAITFLDESAPLGSPRAGVSLGDNTLALFGLPEPAESEALWGHVYGRPQTSSQGVLVPSLPEALAALRDAGVPLVRHDDTQIVIDPAHTGGVVLVVVDQFLLGDPRG
ncbi:MAG: hypothetical protein Q7V88_10265 [Actinomycetota bacterium]|nr:hypothetical protein [Actinomycetota bacterium]